MDVSLARGAVAAVAIVAFVIVAYLGVVLMAWQELRCIHNQQQRHNGELERLELAHKSIEQGIELIEGNITKCVGDEVRSQEEKLTNLQEALEKNEQEAKEVRQRLDECQLEVVIGREIVRKLTNFNWLKSRK